MEISSFTHCSVITFMIFICNILIGEVVESLVKLPENATIPAVIVFGDSIVDNGNNNNLVTLTKCNFHPYGIDFLGEIPTGRFGNGKTPSDLIAGELGVKELLPAYLDPNLQPEDLLTGVTFASGGCGYDPQTSQIVSVLSLSDQITNFKEYIEKLKRLVGEERTRYILAKSAIFIALGTDDILNTYFAVGIRKQQFDIGSYTDLMIHWASDFIKEIHELGGRRIIVFNVPPIGCLPSQRTLAGGIMRSCSDEYNNAAQLFNNKLLSMIKSLTINHDNTNARVVYADVFNPFFEIIQNYKKYGFEVSDIGCCGTGTIEVIVLCNKMSTTCKDRSKYLFWDSFHPSEKGYTILVNNALQTFINDLFSTNYLS